MSIRAGFGALVLLGSSLGASTPASASDFCIGTGTITFVVAVMHGPTVPLVGATPIRPNQASFGISGACMSGDTTLSGVLTFPTGATCEQWSGSGFLNPGGPTFGVEMLVGTVVLTGRVTGGGPVVPHAGTSCRADQGGVKNFTAAPWVVCVDLNVGVLC